MVYFLFFFSLITSLFANSSVTENDPSSLVNGVSVITGDFYSYDEDYLVEGAQPISIRRAYLSNGSIIVDRPHLYASLLSTLNAIIITEPNGTQLHYLPDGGNRCTPKIGDSFFGERKTLYYRAKTFTENAPGVTNTSSGKISGQTLLQNQFILFDSREDPKGKSFSLFTSDGTKRKYVNMEGQTKIKHPLYNDEFYLAYNYKLVSETLPNGHIIYYSWDHENRLKQIRSSAKNHRKTFASIEFPVHDPKKPPLEYKLKGSDGRSLQYFRKQTNKQEESFLEKISAPDLPCQRFDWKTKPRPQLSHYSLPNKRTLQISYEENAPYRVKTLSSPTGKDEKPIVTQSFFYDMQRKQTDVRDAKGFKTSYFWNDKYRLTHIDRFGEKEEFKSSEVFAWDGTFLKSKWLIDQDRRPLFLRKYKYDPQGNVSEELFYGNLSGVGPPLEIDANGDPIQNGVECFAKTATYVDLKKNLLQEKNEAHGLTTRYRYFNDTNLLEAKELLDHGQVKIRYSYTYDEDLILIRETVDDGQTVQIKIIHPVKEGPYLGLPEVIEQKYLDGLQEILLQKTVLKYTEGAKISEKEVYDANDKLQYVLYFTYENGQLKTESNPLGQVAENRYDEIGNRIYAKDFSGRKETTFSYDYSNRLISKEEKGFDGIIRRYDYEYDTQHNLEVERDVHGNETKHAYNAFNQKIFTTLPPVLNENGEIATPILKYDYDSAGNEILRVDAEGYATKTTYNAYGKPVIVLHPDKATETYCYNLDGSLKTHRDATGVVTSYTYDYLGRTTSKKRGDTIIETLEYTGFQLTKKIDAEENETIYTYDKAGRKKTETLGKETISYTYDSMGRVRTIRKGDLFRIYEYDVLGQITQERTESLSKEIFSKIAYVYDEAGNKKEIIRFVDGVEAKEICAYDSQNRLIRKTNPLGHTETIEYNDAFVSELNQKVLQKTHTDAMGLQTIETYDPLGRVIRIEKKKTKTLSLSNKRYDLRGHLTLQIDTVFSPNGEKRDIETRWHYNSRGHLDTLTEAGTKITSYTYSPRGELKTVTKPSLTVLLYDYNDLGQLISLTSSDGTVSHQMTYNRMGALLTTDGITRTVDPHGRISSESYSSGVLISNVYDVAGRRKECRIPLFDCLIEYQYNPAYLKQVDRKTLNGRALYSHTYDEHDLSGNLLSVGLINGQKIHYTVDPLSRQTSIRSPQFTQEVIEFDPIGNIQEMRLQEDLLTYTYDDLYQLTSETGLFAHEYRHDSMHNRLQKDSEVYEVNPLNQMISYFVYDLDGNPIRHNDTLYNYDALDRLIRIETPSFTQEFTYDSLHRCISKTIIRENGEEVLYFLYDGQNEIGAVDLELNPLELRILGHAPHAEIGSAIAVELDGVIYTPIHDLQGSIAVLKAIEAQETTIYRYSAFGEELIYGSDRNPWRFSSKRTDSMTSLINFGRRYYLPNIGRWLTPDPAGFSDGMNLYAFVHNDPLTHLDEYGLATNLALEKATAQVYYQCAASQDIKNYLDGKYLFQNHYHHYQPQKNTPFYTNFDTARIRPKGEIVVFTGINTKFHGKGEFTDTLSYISSLGGGLPIHGIHMPTHGRFQDIRKCQYTLAMGRNSTVFHGAQYLREASERVGPEGRILAFAHSGGGMNLFFASMLVSPEIRAKINYVTFAPAKILPRTDFSDFVQNYRSSNPDPLMWYLKKAYSEEYDAAIKSGLMTVIPAHADASKINDHPILSPTFMEIIKDSLIDFTKQHDCR